MIFFGKPIPFTRFLGQVDQDDPTNLPVGVAAVCRNTDFTLDSPGVTCANTRAGITQTMQGVNKAPITGLLGFVYEPELPTEAFFQMPLLFDLNGTLQQETPVGSGHMRVIPPGVFVPPANSHMIGCEAGNQVYAAYSNLLTPTSGASCFSPKTLTLNPLGMKPFGWTWQANTPVLEGEVCTPPTPVSGNGHTYQAQNSGMTGANAPVFPTNEGFTVNDNGIVWKELTMVLANRLPAPGDLSGQVVAGGTFAAGQLVFIRITYTNAQGESLPSDALVAVATGASAVQVTIPALANLSSWIQGLDAQYVPMGVKVYVAVAESGGAEPTINAYEEYGSGYPLGTVVTVTQPGTGVPPPTSNTARITPGQLPTPDVEPDITRDANSGTFPAGRDVYLTQTYVNSQGETKPGPPNVIINTNADDGVLVTIAEPEDENNVALYTITAIGIYEADVMTGTPAPDISLYNLVGYFAVGQMPVVGASAAGAPPPTSNTTGPGGNIVADTSTGGPNGSQGYRYAAVMFINENETISGFTQASVVKYIVDEDGWELGAFNVATGPSYIVGRIIAFTVADGTQAGPFNWNGLVNLTMPAQNVVYPQTVLSDGIAMTATVLFNNVTTQGVFNFTDEYLEADNDVTDRLRVMAPPTAVRVDYLESVDRIALTGVPGYYSGVVISLGEDYESFYGDTSPVPVAPNGERAWGITDKYKGIPFVIRERSGFVLTPGTGDPSTWDAKKRWDNIGACGPRAWDACSRFICFVHRSGFYKYDETDPDTMSKEVPRVWSRINWQAAQTICCTIDEETHTVRLQVPTGNSPVPNEEYCLSYLEGWQNPIHYSTFSGKEQSMDAARRWSFNDFAAFCCMRMERAIPNVPPYLEQSEYLPRLDRSYYVSQLLYGSSAADGAVHARTPGIYNDNGAGIDWQYETVSAGMMQATTKVEGLNLNAAGLGTITCGFLAARDMVTGPDQRGKELRTRDINLQPDQTIGITRKVPPKINEFWRVRFTNGKQPDCWASLKSMTVYLIPWSGGRGELDR